MSRDEDYGSYQRGPRPCPKCRGELSPERVGAASSRPVLVQFCATCNIVYGLDRSS